ncbi:MAG: hypothetical protein OXF03_07160 [Gammaproteobacteria bacterium]|nr:hypothetical protein [Gammaproteobacteria bacterium]MCY4255289.1 hypothetical protein [Gammaproteobacteria bacterium]MCY4340017.1 hypothetical protein [Gammaproteobacteria bacterium]
MRVLINQESAAVAGGDQSECERCVTVTGAVTGGVIGAAAGSMAGGVGAGAGALSGAGVGALVGDLVGPTVCSWFGDDSSDSDDESDSEEGGRGNPFRPNPGSNVGPGGNVVRDYGAPLQYVVDTWSY